MALTRNSTPRDVLADAGGWEFNCIAFGGGSHGINFVSEAAGVFTIGYGVGKTMLVDGNQKLGASWDGDALTFNGVNVLGEAIGFEFRKKR